MKRQLVIIRHGEGEHLTEGFFSSRPAHPNYRPAHLTPKGRAQSIRAGRQLAEAQIRDADTQVVLTSPLPRTLETAEGVLEGSGIHRDKLVVEDLLLEISLGDMEGTSTQAWIDSGRWFTDFSDAHTYGGETNEDVIKRMRALLDVIATTYTEGHVIAVTHSLPAYELSGLLTGTKTELAVADPLFIDLDVAPNGSGLCRSEEPSDEDI